jgi:hypothetical protein
MVLVDVECTDTLDDHVILDEGDAGADDGDGEASVVIDEPFETKGFV